MAELILALDLPDAGAALGLLDRLGAVPWVKLGPGLVTREGPSIIEQLAARGASVFLDLKWHDIPNTVRGAVAAARDLGVRMVTVHTLGGAEMMAAAAEAAANQLWVVGVTVLTSHSAASYARATGQPPIDLAAEAVRQAREAVEAGLDGVVSSGRELGALRRALGDAALLVVPGIRRNGDRPDDQNRTTKPAEAVALGATHLVVGRTVLNAPDPGAAWNAVRHEIA